MATVASAESTAPVRRFLKHNKRLSASVAARLPQARENIHRLYPQVVARYADAYERPAVVVDVGGGRKCDFARLLRPASPVRIVAVDISAEELELNGDVQDKRVADVTEGLPFGAGEVDMIVSHSVIEHLPNVEAF